MPFADKLSRLSRRKGGEPLANIVALIRNLEVQIALIWDEGAKRPRALIGWHYIQSGDEVVAEIRWTTGDEMMHWRDLISDLERYLKQHAHCTISRLIVRPGWRDFLKRHHYKMTHLVMEKRL
jgi:hypothetical protein